MLHRTLNDIIREACRMMLGFKEAWSVLFMAVAGYLVFYAWPYLPQYIDHLRVAVVDLDQSATSRRFIETLGAGPTVDVVSVTPSPWEAQARLKALDINAIVTIPLHYEADLGQGQSVTMPILANGAYPVQGRAVEATLAKMVSQPSRLLDNATVLAAGLPAPAVMDPGSRSVSVQMRYAFNRLGGYANYTVPIVGGLILQAVLLMSITLTIGRYFKHRPVEWLIASWKNRPLLTTFGMLVPYMVLGFLWLCYLEGLDFYWFEFETLNNLPMTLFVGLCYTLSIVLFGFLIAAFFRSYQDSTTFVVLMASPALFASGLIFPLESMEYGWAWVVASFLPSTPGLRALVMASQLGCGWPELMPYIGWMLMQALVYLFIIVLLQHWRHAKALKVGSV